ncbi:geranylgeranylglyceryl/heptaprenylglyceryl phosphate synthase [Methanolapillus ohkumae]|uniref:Geranylgeranylglyceryl phosphate synthase n=1 Tax=Methanolapillus ohkumae TaxID=3028298 RepID=A0AA96VFC8_9EURY|nr:Geranylgeranylglyceryl phosphate synthase [Methanosarcinaceae archaeon Am2]
MTVEDYLSKIIQRDGVAHITLIDPASQKPEESVRLAIAAAQGGTDAIMLGGSTDAGGQLLDITAKMIKEKVKLPIILFPGNTSGFTTSADCVLFMSLLNSRDPHYIVGNQVQGAYTLYKVGMESIPMAYLVCEPGGTVGWVGDVKLLPRKKPELAAAYALTGKYFGMRYTYLEAGSGAESALPPEMIATVKHILKENVLIVGGGIRDGKTAAICAKAGADIIVTGTAIEKAGNAKELTAEIVQGAKAGKKA